jgi:hypothetical protein
MFRQVVKCRLKGYDQDEQRKEQIKNRLKKRNKLAAIKIMRLRMARKCRLLSKT